MPSSFLSSCRSSFVAPLVFALAAVAACASVKPSNAMTEGTGGARGTGTPDGGASAGASAGASDGSRGTVVSAGGGTVGGCKNLQCQQTTCIQGNCVQHACPNGEKTTVSGKVYDPAGNVPLYNVIVYVPNAPLAAITEGVSCDKCDGIASGSPVASALTDATGSFVLDNVPVGVDVPLVIQIGKWRRKVMIPNVVACADTLMTDKNLTRLPRNQAEGHLPQIALSTGHADAVDCFLRQIGISDSEFTNDSGNGRVHMYVGGDGMSGNQGSKQLVSGQVFSDAYKVLFANADKLATYDVLLLQCESSQLESSKTPYVFNMKKYADNGGRIFAEHLHSVFFRKGPAPWPTTAKWLGVAPDLTSSVPGAPPVVGMIDTSFPKGMAFGDWLTAVGASSVPGQVPLESAQHSVDEPLSGAQRWIYTTAPTASVQYLTFNTPVEAAPADQCGRAVFTDVHVGTGSGDSHPDKPFPMGCLPSTTLSPQAKALEFMLFDLSSCVQPDIVRPVPPPIE